MSAIATARVELYTKTGEAVGWVDVPLVAKVVESSEGRVVFHVAPDLDAEDESGGQAALFSTTALVERIRRHREMRRWSQAYLAGRMKVFGHDWWPQTVLKVEKQQRTLSFAEGGALAEIFGLTLDELAFGEDEVAEATE